MEGWGKFQWTNGDYYEGTFSDNQAHGKGKYHSVDGGEYEGSYQKGEKSGQGRLST